MNNGNQQYSYPQMGNDPKVQGMNPQGNMPNSYGQYNQPNPGMEYAQQMQNPASNLGSNPNNLPNASLAGAGQPQMDRGFNNQVQNMGQPQSYQHYENQQPAMGQQMNQNYPNSQGYRQENTNLPGANSQFNPGMGQQYDNRGQNLMSYDQNNQIPNQMNMNQNQYVPKQPEFTNPHERSQGIMGQGPVRNESSMPTSYGQQQNIGGMQRNPQQMPPVAGQPQSNDQNMMGGFFRQMNGSLTMDSSAINENQPQFNYNAQPPADPNSMPSLTPYIGGGTAPGPTVGVTAGGEPNQPSFQLSGMGGNQPSTPGMPNFPKNNDASSMDIGSLNRMAEYYATNSDYPKAIEYFEKMTNICRENGHAWTALGHCYLLKEDLHKSFQAYQNALYYLENIMDPQLWYGIGILYEKFESYEHAISSLMAVLKMSPNFYQKSEVLSRLGFIFAKTNDIANAILYFQNSILTNTFNPKRKVEILVKIGILHEERNDLAEAQKSYEAALNLEQDNYTIYQHIAWNSYLQGNNGQAFEYVAKAEEKNKANLDTQYIKARINQQLGMYDEASRLYQSIIQQNSNSALYWCSFAVLNYEQNQCEQAFEKIISATKLNGQMVESWYNFGVLYEK